jgi:hypothetical protein
MLAVAAAVGVGAANAVAEGPTFAAAQHNIEHDHIGGLRYVAEHDRPIAMTANEVCFLPLLTLTQAVGTFGYGSHSAISRAYSSVCTFGDQEMHLFNVAFTQGAVAGSGVDLNAPSGTDYPMPYTDGSQRRGVPCLKGAAYGFTWHVCTAHLQPNSFSRAHAQSVWLEGALGRLTPGPRIVGGDFNLRPRGYSGENTGHWRGSWQEGDDTCFAWAKDRKTVQPGQDQSYCHSGGPDLNDVKIDYLWASAFWFVDTYGVADIRCGVASDHCLYFSVFRWR